MKEPDLQQFYNTYQDSIRVLNSKDFDGTLKDIEVMQLIGIACNTYYRYKKELTAGQQ